MIFHFVGVKTNLRAFYAIFPWVLHNGNGFWSIQISTLKCYLSDVLRINNIGSYVSYLHCDYYHKHWCTSSTWYWDQPGTKEVAKKIRWDRKNNNETTCKLIPPKEEKIEIKYITDVRNTNRIRGSCYG